ncbi:MAG: ABC transporter ATP-binding protein [Phycisphaerales bacterium]|nr:ABC transporter ATP-binding protein [Phycisphaerales bacterium]
MSLAIDLHDVRKVFGRKVHALRGVTMQVHRGEIFGLLGPNGAGKSTLVKIMMTVVRPTRARGTVLEAPVGQKATLARIGYLPEHHRFPRYLTGRQAVEFIGGMTGMDRSACRRRGGELLEIVGMSEWADRPIGDYSKGMMQRTGLASALVNEPDLVLLDEPTDGVDPVGRREIRDLLLALREKGMTVFLNSHLLSELEMVCDRVAILVQGEVASQGTIDQLTADSRRYEVLLDGPVPDWIDGLGGHAVVAGERIKLIVPGSDPEVVQPVIDRARSEGRVIRSVTPVRESLEDLFMRAVRDPTTGKVAAPGARIGGGKAGKGGSK